MAQSKKFVFRVAQENGAWTTEINRRVTSRVSVVTTSQVGFATEAEAQAWGQAKVQELLQATNINELNKRRAMKDTH